jgi:hypothetical protein
MIGRSGDQIGDIGTLRRGSFSGGWAEMRRIRRVVRICRVCRVVRICRVCRVVRIRRVCRVVRIRRVCRVVRSRRKNWGARMHATHHKTRSGRSSLNPGPRLHDSMCGVAGGVTSHRPKSREDRQNPTWRSSSFSKSTERGRCCNSLPTHHLRSIGVTSQ